LNIVLDSKPNLIISYTKIIKNQIRPSLQNVKKYSYLIGLHLYEILLKMTNKRPLILVTNDDGITAPGIRALIQIMNTIGDVIVVAPDRPQSGMGHAITVDNVLHCNPITIDDGPQIEYSCSGTPADCVKMAVNEILNRKPDLCVSGINHGANSSINVIYSGTMSAAVEAGIEGVPAIGFSLLDFNYKADFKQGEEFVKRITLNALKNGIPEATVLNVNIPKLKKEHIKGIKICRQANGYWREDFDKRKSPFGKEYYWLSGEFVNKDKGEDTDIWALENGYVSIVPVQFDLTAHHMIQKLNSWDL
jgi:5'-nucleotidase